MSGPMTNKATKYIYQWNSVLPKVKCPLCRRKKVVFYYEKKTTGIKAPIKYRIVTEAPRRNWPNGHKIIVNEMCRCQFCFLEWELALSREWWKEY